MFYTSRRRKLYDFFKTGNLKYYIAFGFVFVAVITAIIIISHNRPQNNVNPTSEADVTDETSVAPTTTEAGDNKGGYRLILNKANHQITVYAYDARNELSDTPVRYILCSHGDIREGTYRAQNSVSKFSWMTDSTDRIFRYVSDFGNGVLFRTAEYSELNDRNSLKVSEYSVIGEKASDYGIVMVLSDAKWIYENCGLSSEIVVITDDTEEVSDTAIRTVKIPAGLYWDPSEDIAGSPWLTNRLKSIKTVSDSITLNVNASEISLLSNVIILDEYDNDCSSKVFLTGKYDLTEAGEYTIVYNAVDIFGNHLKAEATLTVIDPTIPSETETETDDTEDDTTDSSTTDENNTSSDVTDNSTSVENASETSGENVTEAFLETDTTEVLE